MTNEMTTTKKKGKALKRPKLTKEERRAKYTEIARKRRQKEQNGGRSRFGRNGGGGGGPVCYNCRQPGHRAANCPMINQNQQCLEVIDSTSSSGIASSSSTTTTLCYKCGSTEHSLHQCPKRRRRRHDKDTEGEEEEEELPYATCFICNQTGHLASKCPQNTKGVYVNGGSCRICGMVTHLSSNCPHKSSKKKRHGDEGSDDDDDDQNLIESLLEKEDTRRGPTVQSNMVNAKTKSNVKNDGERTSNNPSQTKKTKKHRVVTF